MDSASAGGVTDSVVVIAYEAIVGDPDQGASERHVGWLIRHVRDGFVVYEHALTPFASRDPRRAYEQEVDASLREHDIPGDARVIGALLWLGETNEPDDDDTAATGLAAQGLPTDGGWAAESAVYSALREIAARFLWGEGTP